MLHKSFLFSLISLFEILLFNMNLSSGDHFRSSVAQQKKTFLHSQDDDLLDVNALTDNESERIRNGMNPGNDFFYHTGTTAASYKKPSTTSKKQISSIHHHHHHHHRYDEEKKITSSKRKYKESFLSRDTDDDDDTSFLSEIFGMNGDDKSKKKKEPKKKSSFSSSSSQQYDAKKYKDDKKKSNTDATGGGGGGGGGGDNKTWVSSKPNMKWKSLEEKELLSLFPNTYIPLKTPIESLYYDEVDGAKTLVPLEMAPSFKQRGEAWFKWRVGKVGASSLSILTGLYSPFSKEYSGEKFYGSLDSFKDDFLGALYGIKMIFNEFVNKAMEWGTNHEETNISKILEKYGDIYEFYETGSYVVRAFDDKGKPYQFIPFISPDGALRPKKGIKMEDDRLNNGASVEMKCVFPFREEKEKEKTNIKKPMMFAYMSNKYPYKEVVPTRYVPQTQAQMYAMSKECSLFSCYSPAKGTKMSWLKYDKDYVALMFKVLNWAFEKYNPSFEGMVTLDDYKKDHASGLHPKVSYESIDELKKKKTIKFKNPRNPFEECPYYVEYLKRTKQLSNETLEGTSSFIFEDNKVNYVDEYLVQKYQKKSVHLKE